MRGIILAGGSGTRLYPITRGISKQIMPVYDKPMIYYPLSTLMMAGIREVLVITTPEDQGQFRHLLGDGSDLGIGSRTPSSPAPRAWPRRSSSAPTSSATSSVALVLGDNIFYGAGLGTVAGGEQRRSTGGRVFAYRVADPTAYGVVEFGDDGTVLSIEEKPRAARSRYAVPGLYFYDNDVVEIARDLKPSDARRARDHRRSTPRTCDRGDADVTVLDRGTAWFDTGTFESLMQASRSSRRSRSGRGTRSAASRRSPSARVHRRRPAAALAEPLRQERVRRVPAWTCWPRPRTR